MTGALISNIIIYVLIAFCIFLWLILCVRFVKNKFSHLKTVRAIVSDKYVTKTSVKIPSVIESQKYIVVFSTDEKRLAFRVSSFSYDGYKIKEKGTLTYKGNKIIDFK